MKKIIYALAVAGAFLGIGQPQAAVIDFTGGTVVKHGGATGTTNNSVSYDNADYYMESGFRLDFIQSNTPGSTPFATHIGNYYGAGNDVIHSHWSTGSFGDVTAIEITKVGGGTFDLNYFILTSNTDTGGWVASGNEQAWIEGFSSGLSTGGPILLSIEDWGFPATQVYLGSAFDSVDLARIFVTNKVDCFGMDEFYINEAAPPPITSAVPEPETYAMLLAGLGLLSFTARRKKKIA